MKKSEEKDCKKHRWIPLLGNNKGKTVPTFLFTCLKCGDLKVGTQTIKISRFRLDMGELPINNVAGIRLIEAPSVTKTVSGFTISMTYGESLVPGDLLYFKSDGKAWKAGASTPGTYPVMGLALENAGPDGAGASHLVLLHGIYRDDDRYSFAAGNIGKPVYLSTTAGVETQTQPAGVSNAIQVVGIATHTDRIYFNPSMDYITHV